MARLVIVSNRVGVPDSGARAGGLEVSIRPALRKRGGVWFGWSGRVAEDDPGPAKTVERDNVSYVTVGLRKDDYEEFYNGFANRVLWPILHYRLDLAEFTRRDLCGYFRVNEYFASNLEKVLQPDDVIWVHDYHLIPLAKALRERGHKNKIGFFLHVPCPPPEILTALPNHERLIPSLGNYDLVGFQTEIDATNFSRYLANECGLKRIDADSFAFEGRAVRVGVFPVGVETEAFSRLARRAMGSAFVTEVLESLSGRAMIIGVDRLDYSKGLPERMNAFERFLTIFPEWHGNVTYLQITPHSRAGIPEYADIGRVVGEAVGRINGRFGEASWTPLRYINKAHSRTALAGLYRAARVGAGDAVARRHESGGQGICGGAEPGRSRRADPVALCRRRARMHRGAAGQPLRSRRRRHRHQPRAVDVARRAPPAPRGELPRAGAERPRPLGRALPRQSWKVRRWPSCAGRGGWRAAART